MSDTALQTLVENARLQLRGAIDSTLPDGAALQLRQLLDDIAQDAIEWGAAVAAAPPGVRHKVLASAEGDLRMQVEALQARVRELLSEGKWGRFWDSLLAIAARALEKAEPLLESIAWRLLEKLLRRG